jgi:hypothetical protein
MCNRHCQNQKLKIYALLPNFLAPICKFSARDIKVHGWKRTGRRLAWCAVSLDTNSFSVTHFPWPVDPVRSRGKIRASEADNTMPGDLFQVSPFVEPHPLDADQLRQSQVRIYVFQPTPLRQLLFGPLVLLFCELKSPTDLRLQEDGVQWTKDMDNQLSLFVRKYCFDFDKASKAMRAFVEHVHLPPSPNVSLGLLRESRFPRPCILHGDEKDAGPVLG